MSKVCASCGKQASFTLFHRDGTESYKCGDCPNPEGVHSIAKIGLESLLDNKYAVRMEEK